MNAILSLCHFCELHGPRIVFNTQTFRDQPSICKVMNVTCAEDSQTESKEKTGHYRDWKYGSLSKEQSFKSQPASITETCPACRSFPHNKAAIISNDDANQVSFVSSQYPLQEELFSLVRQAGIRSLSCEVYSEREGLLNMYSEREEPIYFGDDARGHVISYIFLLKDLQARGSHRRYSILVMMKDKMFLLNSWTFFMKGILEIIKMFQDLAYKVYSVEKEEASYQLGLKHSNSPNAESGKHQRAAGNPRPLTELVGEKQIWKLLHSKFTWILKAGGMRLQEKLVEGPPLYVPKLDEGEITLHTFLKLVGRSTFERLMHHVYIGNKIILRSSDAALLSYLPLTLKPLFPKCLYHPMFISSKENLKKVADENIITILPSVDLEEHFGTFILTFNYQSSMRNEQADPIDQANEAFCPSSYNILVEEPVPLLSRPPQVVTKISSLFDKKNLSTSVLSLYLATLMDEWTNKVRIWAYVSRNLRDSNNTSSPAVHCIPQTYLTPEDQGRRVLSRSPSPVNFRTSYSATNASVLLTVGALECDVPFLNALNDYYSKYS